MLKFEVNYRTKTTYPSKYLKQIVQYFFKESKLKGQWYFSLAFVGEAEIKKLNHKWRGQKKATDVLSFAEEKGEFINPPEEKNYLGEVVICAPIAKRQAKEFNVSFEVEVARLLIHGLAHLVGYEHERVSLAKARKMENFEKRIGKILKMP
ncbi:MAG: rRNA maturation RNase YbeY [Patescibacteria group bacterium]